MWSEANEINHAETDEARTSLRALTERDRREWDGGAYDRESLGVCGSPDDDRYGGDW